MEMIELHKLKISGKRIPIPRSVMHKEDMPYGLCAVPFNEKISIRRAVQYFAIMFKREFEYDILQYSIQREKPNDDDITKPFLFGHYDGEGKILTFGGCCFRHRVNYYKDVHDHWGLQWVWIHPFMRNKGFLGGVWPYFEDKFGDFMIERPVSKAMGRIIATKPMKYKHDYADYMKEIKSE
jgi:hypothetical protein